MQEKIIKKIYLPDSAKKLLIGSTVIWEDTAPLSMADDMLIKYYFDTKTTPSADLLLKKKGLEDVSQFASLKFHWHVLIENIYEMSNRDNEKPHIEPHRFNYHGIIYPMGERFRAKRDAFYIAKNFEFSFVPDDHKNKKFYKKTRFTCTVIGI